MTIASEITRINTNIANAYTACNNKGATMPATQNSANLATCVSSIPTATEPMLASLTVTPSTTAQTLTPPSGTDGYNTVTVSAVTASIDSDIVAENIKSGVNILGVAGTVTALAGETRTVSITSTSGNTFTPSNGKNGITSIKCNPTNKALTITPSKTSQTKTVPSGYSGYGTVTCNAVTSSIDSNITAGNIKSGVSILGVAGTYSGITPTGTYTITANGTYDVTNYASANVNVSGGGTGLIREVANGKLQYISSSNWSMPSNVTAIAKYALYYAFYFNYSIINASFPNVVSITDDNGYMFYNAQNLETISFPELTTLTNCQLSKAFYRTKLQNVSFPKLATISGHFTTFEYAFQNCTSLNTLSFPSLTPSSFSGTYTGYFNRMLQGVTGCTVHFPSNLQSVIGSWSSVTSGFNGTNTTVLFDL